MGVTALFRRKKGDWEHVHRSNTAEYPALDALKKRSPRNTQLYLGGYSSGLERGSRMLTSTCSKSLSLGLLW